jgi:hypothetical protein
MLNPVEPTSLVVLTTRPLEDPLTGLEVRLVTTTITSSVWPLELADAFHFVVDPLPRVLASVTPNVGTLAMDLIILKFSFVAVSVRPFKVARPLLSPLNKVANIHRTIGPLLFAFPMLLILDPRANILTTSIRGVLIRPLTMCLVKHPLAFIKISISMYKSAETILSSRFKITFESRTIRPKLDASSLPNISAQNPLPFVSDSFWAYFSKISFFELVFSRIGLEFKRPQSARNL